MGCRLFGQERLPNQAEKVDTEQDLEGVLNGLAA
jgi:hypothetical protein